MAEKRDFWPSKCAKKSKYFLKSAIFQTTDNFDNSKNRNKILSHFYFIYFFPGGLKNWKMAKNQIFCPQTAPRKIQFFLKSAIFQATDIHDSSKWPQQNSKLLLFSTLFSWGPRKIGRLQKMWFLPKKCPKIFSKIFKISYFSSYIHSW